MPNFILCDQAGVEVRGVGGVSLENVGPTPDNHVWVQVPSLTDWTTQLDADGTPVATPRVIPPEVLLSSAKHRQRTSINALRERREFSRFTWDGSVFDCDERSQARLQGALQLANMALATGQPFSVDWTLADNTVRTLASMDMVGVGQALAGHVLTCHLTARALKAQIDAAASIEEVEAVAWPVS